MSEITIYEAYTEELNREIDKIENKLVNGTCQDFTDYKAKCREVKAYKLAKAKYEAAVRQHMRSENEDFLKRSKEQ